MDKKLMAASRKARQVVPNATVSIAVRDITRPARPRMMNPNKGSNSTHRVKFVINN
jgi:hypothetical protein